VLTQAINRARTLDKQTVAGALCLVDKYSRTPRGRQPFASALPKRSLGLTLIVIACLGAAIAGGALFYLGYRMPDTVATEQELRQKVAEAASTFRLAGYALALLGFLGIFGFRMLLAAGKKTASLDASTDAPSERPRRRFMALDETDDEPKADESVADER